MSFSPSGVKFIHPRKSGLWLLGFLGIIELALSVIFVISLAGVALFPERSDAIAGVSKVLSYQGRLTDASGNALTGTYCMKFSFYDAPSVGTKLWPAGAPNPMTESVSGGVFNDDIGDTSTASEGDDLSTYDFSGNDAPYLDINVAPIVGTCVDAGEVYETLAPRQRIDAVGFAREAQEVYGGEVRVGTGAGAGAGSQKLVKLDVVNVSETVGAVCTTNGSLWYNSNTSKALVCEAGLIAQVVNAGGGSTPSYLRWQWPAIGWGGAASTITNVTALSSRPFFWPVILDGNITLNNVGFGASRAVSNVSNLFSVHFGVYTFVNTTQLSLLGSASDLYSQSATGSVSNIQNFWMTSPRNVAAISSLSPGNYVFGMMFAGTATANMNYLLYGNTAGPLGEIFPGANSVDTATSNWWVGGLGRYTVNSAVLPNSFGQGNIIGKGSGASAQLVPVIYVIGT